jgi:hypothetical protein
MLMIHVVNRRTFHGPGIYIGRQMKNIKGSPLGNRFRIGTDGGRDEVIGKYRAWLWREIKSGKGPALEELRRLAALAQTGQDVYLVCWCAPQRCHGDIAKAAIEWMMKQP